MLLYFHFRTVFKARHKVTNELVAIKQIAFTNEKEGVRFYLFFRYSK